MKGVVVCTLSHRDVFRGASETTTHTGSAPPCAGAALGVLTNMWMAALDNSIALCEARSGRCSARLGGSPRCGAGAGARARRGVERRARLDDPRVARRRRQAAGGARVHARSVHALVHCGRVVWSGGADASLTMWSVAERVALLRLPSHNSDVLSTIVAVGERCVWAGSWDGTVTLWTGPAHDWRWRPPARDAAVELADEAAAAAATTTVHGGAGDSLRRATASRRLWRSRTRFSAGFAVAAAKRERLLGIRRAPAMRNIAAVSPPPAAAPLAKCARRRTCCAPPPIGRATAANADGAATTLGGRTRRNATAAANAAATRASARLAREEFAELLADENSECMISRLKILRVQDFFISDDETVCASA
jgi:hypothetical protein